MSKSLGNYIGVAEPPQEIYGKVMSIPDSLITQYFELLTDVPDKDLAEIKQELESGSVNPMEIKKRLAREITGQLYDQAAAVEAGAHFVSVVQGKEAPEDIRKEKITDERLQKIKASAYSEEKGLVSIKEVGEPETERKWIVSVPLLLCEIGLAKSRSDAKRLISQECVVIDGKTVYETKTLIKIGSIIKVGPLRWVRLV
jgi:tyrosyl-tRNA synthetase